MRVVVLGCGRVGAQLAGALSEHHDVSVVDWDSRAFDRLPPGFTGRTVVGNGIDVDVLLDAGAATAHMLFAVTQHDNRNLMAAQVARSLGTRKVVARVYDRVRAEVFASMGVTTVSPTVNGAQSLFNLVTAR